MLDDLVRGFGSSRSTNVVGGDGVDFEAATDWCAEAASDDEAVYLLGTTLAFNEWTRWLVARDRRVQLHPESRVMDTGGSKGRPDLDRRAIIGLLESRLGIQPANVVNEFGMTELLSQRYSRGADGLNLLVGPPWLRTRALDPVSLEVLPDGVPGILCHFDLANAGSVSMVLTEDMGVTHGESIEWLGRTPGSPPRGCSLATAELLEAERAG